MTKEIYVDFYEERFENGEEDLLFKFLKTRSEDSYWFDCKVKDLSCEVLEGGPIFTEMNRDKCKLGPVSEIAIMDTQTSGELYNANASQFALIIDEQGYLLSDVALAGLAQSLIGATGNFYKLPKEKQKEAVELFKYASNEKTLRMFYSYDKIRAIQSSKYQPLDQYELLYLLWNSLEEEHGIGNVSLLNARYNHNYTWADILVSNDTLLEEYKEACSFLEKDSFGEGGKNIKPYVSFHTSDSGTSAARIKVGLSKERSRIMLGDAMAVPHLVGNGLNDYKENLKQIFAQFTNHVLNLMDLIFIKIKNPLVATKKLAEEVGFSNAYVSIALEEMGVLVDKKEEITAHTIFYLLQDVLDKAKMDGVAETTTLKISENLARSITSKWDKYDMKA